jgi:hypothetical protein
VPVNGARMTVFSSFACASRTAACAARSRASAACTRAAPCASRLVARSASCDETRFTFRTRISCTRVASRASWSRSARASISVASADATFACACATAAA